MCSMGVILLSSSWHREHYFTKQSSEYHKLKYLQVDHYIAFKKKKTLNTVTARPSHYQNVKKRKVSSKLKLGHFIQYLYVFHMNKRNSGHGNLKRENSAAQFGGGFFL